MATFTLLRLHILAVVGVGLVLSNEHRDALQSHDIPPGHLKPLGSHREVLVSFLILPVTSIPSDTVVLILGLTTA